METCTELEEEPVFICTTNKLHNKVCRVVLNHDVIQIFKPFLNDGNVLLQEFRICDIFGVNIIPCSDPNLAAVYICLLSFPRVSPNFVSCSSGKYKNRRRVRILFQINNGNESTLQQNEQIAWEWRQRILSILHGIQPFRKSWELSNTKRKILAVVNPKSGKKKGVKAFKKIVAPILQNCGVELELLKTEYRTYAYEKMNSTNLSGIYGVIVVGDDHDLSQVVEGVLSRKDANIWRHISYGIIPTGRRGDGVARSLAHSSGESSDYLRKPVQTATLTIARGKTIPLALMGVQVDNNKINYAVLSIGIGVISDIEGRTQGARLLSGTRRSLVKQHLLANLKKYNATLSYTTVEGNHVLVTENDFVLIHGSLLSHIGRSDNFAPNALPGDDVIHLIYVTADAGRVEVLNLLRGMKHGMHLRSKYLTHVKVSEFCIEFGEKYVQGKFTVDGSLVDGKSIRVRVLKQKIKAFCL